MLQFTYNPADEMLSLKDGLNQTTTWGYDQYGRVTNKVDASGTTNFVYKYDPNDRLTNRLSAAKGTTVFRYDPIGNLTNVDYSGGMVYTPSIGYAYDGLNRLTNMLDGLGDTTFAWSPGNQLASENGPWPADAVTYNYDLGSRQRSGISVAAPNASAWTQTYGYDSLMRLSSIASPAGNFGYGYSVPGYPDSGDRVTSVQVNGGSISIGNQYDGLARLTDTHLTTPLWGSERTYSYDSGSEVTQQVVSVSSSSMIANAYRFLNYSYDNIGQLKIAQGFDGQPGYPPNPARLQEQFGYAYDKAWNLNYRTNNALIQTYNVNPVNELSTVSRNGTLTVAGTATEPSANFANPGVTSVTVNTSNAVVYGDGSYAATNMPISGANYFPFTAIAQDNIGRKDTNTITVGLGLHPNYSYDLNGNLLGESSAVTNNRSFAYDDENQLTSVWVTNMWRQDFVYDGLLRKRVEKDYNWTGGAWQKTNEVRFIYDRNVVIQERDGNNLPTVTYTRGNDLSGTLQGAGGIGGLLARTDMSLWVANEPFASAYYFSDGEGNVVAMVNTNGAMVAQYQYDPFGNLLVKSGPLADANRYRFSSKEWNDGPNIYYYGYRFYDPNLQRWPNRDPLGDFGSLVSVGPLLGQDANVGGMTSDEIVDGMAQINGNLFTALGNNPIGSVDLYGLQEICPIPEEIPPELIEQAVRLNRGASRVDLPDGRKVDLRGSPHPDENGKPIPTPHVHEPKAPHPPPYDQLFPRGKQAIPRPAMPQDIQDAINYLQGGGGDNSSVSACGNCNANAPPSQITIPTGTSETPPPPQHYVPLNCIEA